jgi:hypothetical protein
MAALSTIGEVGGGSAVCGVTGSICCLWHAAAVTASAMARRGTARGARVIGVVSG